MSFLALTRFLISLATVQHVQHQCLLCGKLCVDRGYVPHFGLGPVQLASLYTTVVAGPCPTRCQTSYVDNVGERQYSLPQSIMDLLKMRFRGR
jgi:hypothetical protein